MGHVRSWGCFSRMGEDYPHLTTSAPKSASLARDLYGPKIAVVGDMSSLHLLTIPLMVTSSLVACVEMDPEFERDQSAIVGGSDVEISAFPYQISMQDSGGFHYCGGSILSEKWIITATHCVVDAFAGTKIVAGITRLSAPGEGQTVNALRAISFPGYTGEDGKDFALVELAQPLELNGTTVKAIRPLTKPNTAIDAPAVMATVSGWGTLTSGGSSPDVLQSVQVPIVSLAEASAAYQQTLSSDELAAGIVGKDSCQGDSGGPLVVTDPSTNEVFLAGVVSWGFGCGDAGYPGIYARVTSFTDFIEQHAGGPPTAVAEANESAFVNEDVILSGELSVDTGAGTIVSYSWAQTQGDAVELNASVATPIFVAPATAQQLSFELTVVDNSGQSSTASVTIDIKSMGGGDDGGGEDGDGPANPPGGGDIVGGCSTSGGSSGSAALFLLSALFFWRRRKMCS